MKKNESVKAKPDKNQEKPIKLIFSHVQYALIVFAAANKKIRWGDYIRNVVLEQAKKDFKEAQLIISKEME
jgi:hypothetical protein